MGGVVTPRAGPRDRGTIAPPPAGPAVPPLPGQADAAASPGSHGHAAAHPTRVRAGSGTVHRRPWPHIRSAGVIRRTAKWSCLYARFAASVLSTRDKEVVQQHA